MSSLLLAIMPSLTNFQQQCLPLARTRVKEIFQTPMTRLLLRRMKSGISFQIFGLFPLTPLKFVRYSGTTRIASCDCWSHWIFQAEPIFHNWDPRCCVRRLRVWDLHRVLLSNHLNCKGDCRVGSGSKPKVENTSEVATNLRRLTGCPKIINNQSN